MTLPPDALQREIDSLRLVAHETAAALSEASTAVVGYADGLTARHGDSDRDRTDLEEIQTAGRRVAMLAQQLRMFSCAAPPAPAEVDLNRIFAAVHRRLRALLPDGMSLTCDEDAPASVVVDPGQVEQALLNLVLNAQKVVGRGSVHLDLLRPACGMSVAAISARITACGTQAGHGAEVGVPIENCGMNLSAAYGLLHRNGGSLSVDRSADAVVFTVVFPASGAPSEAPREGPLVLVIEDGDAVRRLAGRVLRDNGFRVLEAASAWSARRLFHMHPETAVILADSAVGCEGGLALIRELAAWRPAVRAVLASGPGLEGASGIRAGDVDAVVEKPFTESTILAAVRSALAPRGLAAQPAAAPDVAAPVPAP